MVPRDRLDPAPEARRLAEGVRHQGELGPPRGVVGLAIMSRDDHAVHGGEQGPAETDESLRRLAGKRGPPVAHRGRSAAAVHGDEVDRVPLAEHVDAVAGHATGWAVLHDPAARERERQGDRFRHESPPSVRGC